MATTGGKMKKIVLALLFVMISSQSFAQYVITGYGPVTGNVYIAEPYVYPVPVPQPVPVPVAVPQPVPVPVPVAVPQPVPVPVPVPVPARRPVCTSYPDPWDTLGYIFGDPFMITTCY
jgi:hypothetical protein